MFDGFNLIYFIKQVGMASFALLAITNPFGMLPVFMSMSEDLHKGLRAKLFTIVSLTAAIIMIIFATLGTILMEKFFQVDLASLRIAGGILLIAMGVKNLLFPQETKSPSNNNSNYDVPPNDASTIKSRIVPMAFPLLVGPGALSTIIVIDNESGKLVAYCSILLAFFIIFMLFRRVDLIERLLGKLFLFILSRVMQVFIMTIGAQMLVIGVLDSFPVLKGG